MIAQEININTPTDMYPVRQRRLISNLNGNERLTTNRQIRRENIINAQDELTRGNPVILAVHDYDIYSNTPQQSNLRIDPTNGVLTLNLPQSGFEMQSTLKAIAVTDSLRKNLNLSGVYTSQWTLHFDENGFVEGGNELIYVLPYVPGQAADVILSRRQDRTLSFQQIVRNYLKLLGENNDFLGEKEVYIRHPKALGANGSNNYLPEGGMLPPLKKGEYAILLNQSVSQVPGYKLVHPNLMFRWTFNE